MAATATQNWLGFSANFENVEDKTSESSFELLPEGFYKAEVKNVIKSVIGSNDKPALTVTLELEEGKKEIVHNLFLPETGDEITAVISRLSQQLTPEKAPECETVPPVKTVWDYNFKRKGCVIKDD